MTNTIYPMAFVPNKETKCKIYYIGFPKVWKDKLIEIERKNKPNWNEKHALPTNILKNSLNAWVDGIVNMNPIYSMSNDDKWIISCEPIDEKIILKHINIWLTSYYLSDKKLSINTINEVDKLSETINSKDLANLKGCEEVILFDENGCAKENYTFNIFSLLIVKSLIGKQIEIGGNIIKLNYSGKNELISDIQSSGNNIFSYGIKFSLQTIPPKRETLLLCDCSIHRWIPKTYGTMPYLNSNILAHIWVGKNKIYKIPISYDKFKKYIWSPTDEKYYSILFKNSLPEAKEVIYNMQNFIYNEKSFPITSLYRLGMESNGFGKNNAGFGVSVVEKALFYNQIYPLINKYVIPIKGIKRVNSGKPKISYTTPQLEKLDFRNDFNEQEQDTFSKSLINCIGDKPLNIHIYCQKIYMPCAKEIYNRLKSFFGDSNKFNINIEIKSLGKLGEPLEDEKESGICKRVNEIYHEFKKTPTLIPTACIIILPGKESFKNLDPKSAIRCGFALTNRLTQFIIPWDNDIINIEEENKKDNKIKSTITDLFRQLGYISPLDKKVKPNNLINVPVIGMHLITQIDSIRGKFEFLPIFVEVNYKEGRVYVECDAFENKRVLYYQAAFELAKLFDSKNVKSRCEKAKENIIRQKFKRWESGYKAEDILFLIESDNNTRSICNGISDISISKYDYEAPYCPKEIDIGVKNDSDKIKLLGSKLRILRIRSNGEVPDYFTKEKDNNKHESTQGIFYYNNTFWAIARKLQDKPYVLTYSQTRFDSRYKNFAERDMIEIYPIQLQLTDNPNDWIIYANSLRYGSVQYGEATALPIPMHLGKKLEEYILTKPKKVFYPKDNKSDGK